MLIRYPKKIVNFNAYIGGVSWAGIVTNGTLPEVKLQIADHRGAGMDGPTPVDMGTEAMEMKIASAEWHPDLATLIGTRERVTFKPARNSNVPEELDGLSATVGGLWSGMAFGELKPGEDVPLDMTQSTDYFRLMLGNTLLFEIDTPAGKRRVGDVDQIASLRRQMGG